MAMDCLLLLTWCRLYCVFYTIAARNVLDLLIYSLLLKLLACVQFHVQIPWGKQCIGLCLWSSQLVASRDACS
ncbi:hypothetical protein BRADI_2g33429v3 [Brachypodium distachyon]|uniref:Uncharacterized protein n=1 Tax=Brachypodium distachyon TaxID=15368 RepID=A0A0Q3MS41_BRADI|nr:hypothetical protein BRADI_2g33429v3 [Brachypodium distachyon]